MTRSWTPILRRQSVIVHMARAWQTHDDRTWALLEVENCGAREIGIDFVPNHDEFDLSLLPPTSGPSVLHWRSRGGPSERSQAIARLRYDAGTIYARLGPGERWRFPTRAVDAAEVEPTCRARGMACLDGHLQVITADAIETLHFQFHGVPLPSKVVQAGAWPMLEPMLDRQPEAMSRALRGVAAHESDSASIDVVRLNAPTFHLRGFARDDARIPAIHEPFLSEIAGSLARMPGRFRVHVSGHSEVEAPWPGSGVKELALARARAVADRIGSEPMQVRADQLREYAGCRGVELSLKWGPERMRFPEIDVSDSSRILPSHLFALIRGVPTLHDLPDEIGPALRELEQRNHRAVIALLAPDCVR